MEKQYSTQERKEIDEIAGQRKKQWAKDTERLNPPPNSNSDLNEKMAREILRVENKDGVYMVQKPTVVKGEYKPSFIKAGFMLTPQQIQWLHSLADWPVLTSSTEGLCAECKHSKNGRERGRSYPCGPCFRPSHSHFEARD